MRSKSVRKFQFLFLFASLCGLLVTAGPATADTRQITVNWDYDSSVPAVGGFRLYLQGAAACEVSDASARQLTCSVDLISGDNSFTLTAFDTANNESDPSVPYIYSYSPNSVPTTENIIINLSEDSNTSGTLPATDADNDPLTFSIVNQPGHGNLSLLDSTAGTYSYTPAADYAGADSFSFKVNDGVADSSVATAAITVAPVNDAPLVQNGSATVDEDQSLSGSLTASDVENDALSFVLVSQAAHGTVNIVNPATGAFTYTPAPNYSGTDSFSFKANDGSLDSDVGQVALTVNEVNDPPVADAGVNGSADFGNTVTIDASGSADIDNSIVSYQWSQISGPTVSLADPTAPTTTFVAPDNGITDYTVVFRVQVTDAGGLQSDDTVSVAVAWVNQPPLAVAGTDQNVKMRKNVTLNGSLSSDPDDGIKSVEWQQVSGPQVALSDPFALKPTFVAPNVNPQGDSLVFSITVTDNGGLQAQATTTVNVSWLLPPPTIGLLKLKK